MTKYFFLLFAAAQIMNAQENIKVHGHRGCRGLLPENTLPAFKKAMEVGVDVLEMDLAVNAEGQLVVSHEPWMNPEICTAPNGDSILNWKEHVIYRMSQEEIRAYDCGSKGHPKFREQTPMAVYKPLLSEVVNMVKDSFPRRAKSVEYNIEIKYVPNWDSLYCPDRETFLSLFIKEVEELGIASQSTLQCFDAEILRMANTRQVSFKLSYLVQNLKSLSRNIDRLGFVPSYYSPYFKMVKRRTVHKARELGVQVVPWTVNEPKDIKKMIKRGVDGIISDYPDRVLEVLNE